MEPFEASEATDLAVCCDSCNEFKQVIYPASHFYFADRGLAPKILCDACAAGPVQRESPISLVRPVIEQRQLPKPVPGSFRPVETSVDDPASGAYEYWMETGHLILEELVTWREKVKKFSIGSNRYKGLWIKPHWDGSRVSGFSAAGDTPSKQLELDLYQHTRLTQMGLAESGRSNKLWTIELSESEGDILNAAAVVVHILRHGYLLEPSDLSNITPTLDIDVTEPEWQHLRR